jgi:hypothetical protein
VRKRFLVFLATVGIVTSGLLGVTRPAFAFTDPPVGTIWGCVIGSSNTLEDVYTVQANYNTFLAANSNKCPSSGTEIAIGQAVNENGTDPNPGQAWACNVGADRTVQNVYTTLSAFESFLTSKDGCPNGGFIMSMGPAGFPAVTNYGSGKWNIPTGSPVWGCTEDRTQEYAYTVEANYNTYINGQGGACPGGTAAFADAFGISYSCGENITSGDFTECPESAVADKVDLDAPSGVTTAYAVDNDAWGCAVAEPNTYQDLNAASMQSWQVNAETTSDPTGASPCTYDDWVVSYPDESVTFNGGEVPVSYYSALNSSWTETNGYTGGTWESAYDIWLGGAAGSDVNGSTEEVMIWTDVDGPSPSGCKYGTPGCAGTTPVTWTDSANSTTYDLWVACSTSPCTSGGNDFTTVTWVPTTNKASSGVNILGALNALDSDGFMNTGDTCGSGSNSACAWASGLYQIDYGWEFQNVNDGYLPFTLNHYTLTDSIAS